MCGGTSVLPRTLRSKVLRQKEAGMSVGQAMGSRQKGGCEGGQGPVAHPEGAPNTGRQRALEGLAQGVTQSHLLAQCGECSGQELREASLPAGLDQGLPSSVYEETWPEERDRNSNCPQRALRKSCCYL